MRGQNSGPPAPPPWARVTFAHAAARLLADRHDVHLLHIKGAAVNRSLTTARRVGSDADLLVRPSHVEHFTSVLARHGWQLEVGFVEGSPFAHAAAFSHPIWGQVDVHRWFPGITAPPAEAFDRLWRDRTSTDIAGIECAVPDLVGQTLILVLNAARSEAARRFDLPTAWETASTERRRQVRALAQELGAEVAFAAATGDLHRLEGEPHYDLWRVVSEGGTRIDEWRARVQAAPTRRDAIAILLRAPLVNTQHLRVMLGRAPTKAEVVREFFARPARGLREQRRRGPGS